MCIYFPLDSIGSCPKYHIAVSSESTISGAFADQERSWSLSCFLYKSAPRSICLFERLTIIADGEKLNQIQQYRTYDFYRRLYARLSVLAPLGFVHALDCFAGRRWRIPQAHHPSLKIPAQSEQVSDLLTS